MDDTEKVIDYDKARVDLLNALMTKPSTYYVKVIDKKTLPKELWGKEEISFEVKPPVLSTLTRMSKVALRIPVEYRKLDVNAEEVLKFTEEICEIFIIMAHGTSKKEIPTWYKPFLMDNLTPEDLLGLYQECSMKIRTDFFLPCFQIASILNPMTMKSQNL